MDYYKQYRRLRYELRCLLSLFPRCFLPLAGFKHTDVDGATLVTPDTDLVIEGFPRSANTFSYVAMQMSQPKPLKVAHHFHAPAQVIAAIRWERPALVITREPLGAICSFMQFAPVVTPRQALRNWIRFHVALSKYRDGFVTTTFEQVTTNFGEVIQRINKRFDTKFEIFDHNTTNVAACFHAIEQRSARRFGQGKVVESIVARPSEERARKQHILDALQIPQLDSLRKKADQLYTQYSAWADDAHDFQSE